MTARRHAEAQRIRKPGAGRPRKTPRTTDVPVPDEIIGAASRLFARQGFVATTMAEVADASGLQVSSLYYYFRSKQEMLERIVADVNRIPLEALAAAEATYPDPAARLHAFVRSDATALCEFPFDINEIHRLASDEDDGGVFSRYWAERQQLHDAVEALVAEGIAAGRFVEVDSHLCALTILANDEAAQNWYRPVGARRLQPPGGSGPRDYSADEVGRFLADLALRGLLVDPGALDHIAR